MSAGSSQQGSDIAAVKIAADAHDDSEHNV